jgi:hypothetical protein
MGQNAPIPIASERRRTVTGHPRGRSKLLCAITMLALVALVDFLSHMARRQRAR